MFTTPLVEERVINLRSIYKLVKPLEWHDRIYQIKVPVDFLYDGASVPRLASILFPRKGGLYDRAACLHDWLYGTHILPRKEADRLFYKAMLSDNVPKWKAYLIYKAVRVGGSSSYNNKTEEHIKKLRGLLD